MRKAPKSPVVDGLMRGTPHALVSLETLTESATTIMMITANTGKHEGELNHESAGSPACADDLVAFGCGTPYRVR